MIYVQNTLTVSCEKSKIVSFTYSKINTAAVFPAWSKFAKWNLFNWDMVETLSSKYNLFFSVLLCSF